MDLVTRWPWKDVKGYACRIAFTLWIITTNAYANEPFECLIEPHRIIEVTSSEIGVLASVNVDEADVVVKGDTIAALRMDVENAVLEVSRARAEATSEIELLRRDHDFTVRNRDRVNELNDQQVVSAQHVDQVRTAQDAAWLRLQAAMERQHTSQLEAARDELALARRIVHSPIDGVVISRHKSAGEYVDGDPIVQLAQLDPLRVKVVVPMTMFGKIQVGMLATVLPELPMEGPFVATVTRIDAMLDAATATLSARLSLPNPGHRLPAGLKCTLVLQPMAVPIAAVGAEPGRESDESPESASDMPPQLSAAMRAKPIENTASVALPLEEPATTRTRNPHVSSKMNNSINELGETASDRDFCLAIGPFQDTNAAEAVAAILNESHIQFVRRSGTDKNADGPWTALSRQPHEEAQPLIKRLEQSLVTDFQWFRRGPWEHHMSYGRYRLKENAQTRVNRMQALGFDAVVVPKGDAMSVVWLELSHMDMTSTQSAAMVNVREQNPKLLVQSIACPQLASR